jgi:hypothetical protein
MAITATVVECEQLHCPGCREQVLCEPPTVDDPGLEFCHRDGSTLCGQRAGGSVVQPIEDW